MNRESPENYDIKTRIGSLLFNIFLDDSFRSTNAQNMFNRHNHSAFEIHFIVEGSGFLILDQEKIKLQSNHYCVIPPGAYHVIIPDTKILLRRYTARFNYMELNEHNLYIPTNEVESLKTALSGMHSFAAPAQEENLLLLAKINSELENRSLGYYTKLQSYFNQMLINVVRAASPGLHTAYRIPRKMGYDKRSMIIESFFEEYYLELTLEDLAAKLRLSPRQTNRVLRIMYNCSFRQKLIEIRIGEGKARLKDTEDSIMLISEQLGFTSYPLFYTMFKQKTGVTPHKYRKRVKFDP